MTLPTRPALWTLLPLFFLSGVCGLVYQVLWLRLLSLVFGVTVYAASTVLASFMTGLAAGAWLAAHLVARTRRPLAVFAALELGVGISALLTPLALGAAGTVYTAAQAAVPDSLPLLTLVRFLCAFIVLLVPTVLMGATLPVLSASQAVRRRGLGHSLGVLYATNTAGALVGALATGYVFIEQFGMQRTFLLAASANGLVALLAWAMARSEAPDSDAAEAQPTSDPAAVDASEPVSPRLVLLVTAVSGLASLALEVVWFRLLTQFLTATSYAFTTMLATVLGGIALGSALAARLLREERSWTWLLGLVQAATGLAVLLSLRVLVATYQGGAHVTALTRASVIAILPAAILMGLAFPLTLRLWTGRREAHEGGVATARRVGTVYSANVLGAIAGSVLGGFVLLPWLGSRVSLMVLAGLYVASGVLLLLRRRPRHQHAWAATLALLVVGVGAAVTLPDPLRAPMRQRHGAERLFWSEEGVQTTVSVHTGAFRGMLLYLDGLHQASDAPEMVRLHRLIGHLPMVLHPSPTRALVVGLGGGATPGAVSQYPGTEVDVVELSASVRRAAGMFAHVNYDLLRQPHVRVRVDDGRNFLTVSPPSRYDVITADLIQPEHAGAGNLYSEEYFRLVRAALAPGGRVLQWIGRRPDAEYKLIMRTFLRVFPQATLWMDGELMVGSLEPLTLSPSLVDRKRDNPVTRRAFDDVGLDGFETLLSWYTAGPDEMRAFVGDGDVLTDDRPRIEYFRSLPEADPPVNLSRVRGDVRRHLTGARP